MSQQKFWKISFSFNGKNLENDICFLTNMIDISKTLETP